VYARLDVCGRQVEGGLWQIRDLLTSSTARKFGFGLINSLTPNCQEKPLGSVSSVRTVNRHR
jgi:hypothetical protein